MLGPMCIMLLPVLMVPLVVAPVAQLLFAHLQTFVVVVFHWEEVSKEACLGPFQMLQGSEDPALMEGSEGPLPVLQQPDTSHPRYCRLHLTVGSLE